MVEALRVVHGSSPQTPNGPRRGALGGEAYVAARVCTELARIVIAGW